MSFDAMIDRIPLLLNDKAFLNLIYPHVPQVHEAFDALEEADKRLRVIEGEMISLKRKKKQVLAAIIDHTDQHQKDPSENDHVFEDLKDQVSQINQAVDDLIFESENLPKTIKSLNHQIGLAAVEWVYASMKTDAEALVDIESRIQDLRSQLGDLLHEKFDRQERKQALYDYVHGLLGKDITDKLDQETFKEQTHD